jgi:RNA polymerase sigma factor (sigma-70 family)
MLAGVMNSVHQTGVSMSASSPPRAERKLESLVQATRANDNVAWSELVGRFDGMLRSVARSYRLCPADVDDVLQTVWLRLYQQLDRLREPNAIAGWLATTTRRESLRVLQTHVREQLTDDPEVLESTTVDRPDTEVLASERNAVLRRALGTLPTHQRRLMVLLAAAPADYRMISATLDIPVGSIGPTRARSLARLERHPELRELHLAS